MSTNAPLTEADRRYRVLVSLKRADAPVTWKFHCPRCTMPVGEIVNAQVTSLTDLVDMADTANAMNGTRCDGRFEGSKCAIWYYWDMQ